MNQYMGGNLRSRSQAQSLLIRVFLFTVLLLPLYGFNSVSFGEESPGLKEQFEQKISQLAGVPVSVADYSLKYSTVHLRGIKIGDPAKPELPSANIKELSATCDLMSLLGGNLVLKEINIASFRGRLNLDSQGNPVLGNIPVPATVRLPTDSVELPFEKILGKNLEFKISDERTGKTTVLRVPSAIISKTATAGEMLVDFKSTVELADKGKSTSGNGVAVVANFLVQRFSPLIASGSVAVGPTPAEILLSVVRAAFPGRVGEVGVKGGTAEASVDFSFAPGTSQPQFHGILLLKAIQVSAPVLIRPLTDVQGSVGFDQNHLRTEDLAGQWGTSAVKISGQVNDLQNFRMALNYRVKPLDLTEAGKFLLAADGYTFHGTGQADGTITGIPAQAAIEGTVRFPSCQVVAPISTTNKSAFTFPFQNLVATFRYSGGALAIENAHAGLFGGSLSGSGAVRPGVTPINFSVSAKGQGLRAEDFLAQNTSQKQVVSGPVNATFQADGNTSGLASWNGKGDLSMESGRYQAPPVITPVLSLVNLKEFASGDIQSARGNFVLAGGIMTTNDLYCLSTAGKAYYRGDVGLDTSLKGQLNLVFSQSAVEKSQVLQQISLDGKSVNIPTRVEGTLLAPSFPGFSTEKLLELGLKRQGQKLLQNILRGGKEPAGTNTDTKQKDSGKNLLEDLQNIFNKKKKPAVKPVTSPDGKTSPEPSPAKKEDLLKNELKKLFKF